MKKIPTTLAVLLLGANAAPAIILNFDDQTESGSTLLPDGYKGLNWSNMFALDAANYGISPSGYFNGIVSGDYVAYNGTGNPAVIMSSTSFDLDSAYFTAAWTNDLNVTVKGFNGGSELYSQTFQVDSDAPTLINFNFTGIDEATFNSFGGVSAGYGGNGSHFVMDDMTLSAVPEPKSFALLAGLLAICAAVSRRRG